MDEESQTRAGVTAGPPAWGEGEKGRRGQGARQDFMFRGVSRILTRNE